MQSFVYEDAPTLPRTTTGTAAYAHSEPLFALVNPSCSYFEGRRRKMQMTVKGRFLTPNVSFDSVLTGEGLPL